MIVEIFNVQAIRIGNASIPLADGNNAATVFLGKKMCRVISHISEALNGYSLALESGCESETAHVFAEPERLPYTVLNTAACGLTAPCYAALGDGLSGDTCQVVDASGEEGVVGICHPRHLSL